MVDSRAEWRWLRGLIGQVVAHCDDPINLNLTKPNAPDDGNPQSSTLAASRRPVARLKTEYESITWQTAPGPATSASMISNCSRASSSRALELPTAAPML